MTTDNRQDIIDKQTIDVLYHFMRHPIVIQTLLYRKASRNKRQDEESRIKKEMPEKKMIIKTKSTHIAWEATLQLNPEKTKQILNP